MRAVSGVPVANVGALVDVNARAYPGNVAIVDGERSLTHGDLAERAHAFAEDLAERRVGVGDRVGLLLTNRAEYFVASFGAWLAGAITVPINHRLHAREIDHILDDSNASLLVCESDTMVGDVPPGQRIERVDIDDIDLSSRDPGRTWTGGPPSASVDAPGIQRIMYTSGTTSRPKGVVITHQMVVHNMLAQARDLGLTSDDRLLVSGPLFHVAAFDAPGITVLFLGGTVVVHRRFDPERVLESIDEQQITGTVLVHPMTERLVEASVPGRSHGSMRWISVGARSPIVARRLAEMFPNARLVQGYGLTEACGPVTSLRNRPEKVGTVGAPLPFVEVAVLDDTGARVSAGTVGEVTIRGPKVTPGYWGAIDLDGGESADGGPWIRTGDLGSLDGDGFLTLVDRKKDMIRSGGENVASREIEGVLANHPDVLDAAVVAAPDDRWGEVPVVFVVATPGVGPMELKRHCASQLARFKVPRDVHLVEVLPRNATGKVEKARLRASLAAATESEGSVAVIDDSVAR